MQQFNKSKKSDQEAGNKSKNSRLKVSYSYNFRPRTPSSRGAIKPAPKEQTVTTPSKSIRATRGQNSARLLTQFGEIKEDHITIKEENPKNSRKRPYINQPSEESEEESEEQVLVNMAQEVDVQQLLQALVDRPSQTMQPKVFTGSEKEDIITWIESYDRIAQDNGWNEEKQRRKIPLYLDKSALLYYNSLPDATKENQQLVKEALRRQYHSQDRQWRLRSELHTLTQTSTLTQYIDQLDVLCHQLAIDNEAKLHCFINGLKPHLKEALVLRQPGDYNTAVSYAKLKESASSTASYEEILKLLQAQQKNQSQNQVNNVTYTDPVQQSQEIAKLKAEIKQLKQERRTGNPMVFQPNNRNLRTSDGQPICNICKRVGHTARVCRQNYGNNYSNSSNNNTRWNTSYRGQSYQNVPQHRYRQQNNMQRSMMQPYNQDRYQNMGNPRHNNNHNAVHNFPQDGIYRRNQHNQQQNHNSNSAGLSQGRRSNIPSSQNQQFRQQTNTIANNISQNSMLSTMIKGSINGYISAMLIDSGSVANIIDYNLFEKIKTMSNNITPTSMQLVGAGSNELTVVGETTLPITIDNQDFKTTMVITKDLIQPLILGVKFLTEHNGVLDFSRQQIIFKKNNRSKEARAPFIPLSNAEQNLDSIGTKSVVFEDQMDTKCPTEISTTEFQLDGEDLQNSMAYKLKIAN